MKIPERAKRSPLMFVVVLLTFGLVVPGVAAADNRAKAPVGVWSGLGDQPGDYDVVVIMDGPVGEQPAFFMEAMTGSCDGEPAYIWGIARIGGVGIGGENHDGELGITGDYFCAETGEMKFADVQFWFGVDQSPDSLGFGDGEYPAPFTRKCAGANSTLVGTLGDDVLVGTAGNDVIDGLAGNDTLKGLGGIDILCGQGGNDTLIGGDGIDVLIGASGEDRLRGGSSVDVLLGGSGKDNLKGQGGDDLMFGDAKKDKLTGGGGNDYANGGAGSDTCSAETTVSC